MKKKMSDKVTIKEVEQQTKPGDAEEIEKENKSLMSAFADQAIQERKVDADKLAALKAKLAKKNQETVEEEKPVPTLISQREVSINLGVIGVGQAGSRIAEEFHRIGYDVGIINTSAQDLKFIDVLPSQKLLLGGSLGGTGKDLDLGREIFEDHEVELEGLVDRVAEGNDMLFLALSGGGGTGSSSVDPIIPLLFNTGMPLGVIYVLPKTTQDAQSKKNSCDAPAKLASMTADDMIASMVVVANARVEQIYSQLSQSEFWKQANAAIVEPINLFNTLTAKASRFTSLDPSDFGKIISCGDCSVYGVVEVEDYMEETALAEAVIESLGGNMLAEGFDLSQTRTGGVIILGSEEALNQLPSIHIDYCFSMISDQTNGANIFQGIYAQDGIEGIKIYSWFAGLGLPQDRIENLKKESRAQAEVAAVKENRRASAMTLDLEEDKISSVKDQVQRKIRKKKSGFGKLQKGGRGSIIDKRRRR